MYITKRISKTIDKWQTPAPSL